MKRLRTLIALTSAASAIHSNAATVNPIPFNPVGIPYGWELTLNATDTAQTTPDHVGAWSWDEDGFPTTAKGWTHTSKWVKLDLLQPAQFTLTLESLANVPWPAPDDTNRVAGTNLFPSFTLYRGWDTDAGITTNLDGTTLDQDHTFNNRGDIAWAEDVTYLDHLDNATTHSSTRTWVLPAGQYTINLGGNSPVTVAEGRQGYKATFTTTPANVPINNAALTAYDFNPVGIPYGIGLVMGDQSSAQTTPDHVGAWSWDEDGFPTTAKGWTHTSKWVKLDLLQPAQFTLTLESLANVPWPAPDDTNRVAGTNLFPSFTLYRGWDTDAGITTNLDGTTLDQDHTFNNRGDIAWAEDVSYLDHLDNATTHSSTRTWVLPAGQYTINLGGNSPVTVAEGRQGYKATFTTTPANVPINNAALTAYDFNPVGIPYGIGLVMGDQSSAQTTPDHVGAWSWDEDGFPTTAKGWTHTSKWVKLDLLQPAQFTLTLESLANVPWPAPDDTNRVAGTNLFPSFTLYRGWDTDAGITTNLDGTTLDQDHTFNNRGDIAWAEDVTYLDHLDNATTHSSTRTWVLPAGQYTINLGGNSPVTVAEGRQGYKATFTTTPANVPINNAALTAYDFNPVGIPYGIGLVMGDQSSAQTTPDHVGAWSWDEDGFPTTAKGWTHTSKWVKLDLLQPAQFTLTLESLANVPWPAPDDTNRVAGTNLFPSFTLYRGWDTDAGITTNLDGTTLDQDHTFNNRGDIAWAEDVSYLDHLDNATTHSSTRTWVLPAGQYTINLGGNSPVTVAEGRQGYKATFTTTPATVPINNAVLTAYDFNPVGIPYGIGLVMGDQSSAQTTPDHVGAWSWDEDGFPTTAKGWTHTSKWVKLDLLQPAQFTLTLESLANVPWPAPDDTNRVAGTNLFPSFTLYRGWDTDAGITTNLDGTTLDQDHTFNNRGDIAWAEDVSYLDHLDNAALHKATRTWELPAGQYTINLGGNSPVTVAEGRQGYKATFTTTPALGTDLVTHSALQAVDASGLSTWNGAPPFSVVGILLNNPEEFLDASAGFLPWDSGANIFRLGGQWQIFLQSADPADHAGTACWMGQNYGNLPFIHDSEFSYTNQLWTAEIARLESDPLTGHRFRKGDLVRVNANRSLDFAGKRNINEAHETATEADFSIELVTAGYGLPDPEEVALSQLVRVDDGNPATHEDIFDATRATGGEHWQSRRVRIHSLSLVDAAGWGKTNYADRVCIATDGTGRIFRLRVPIPSSTTGLAPSGTFDAVGIIDQDTGSGLDGTYAYELFVQEIVNGSEPALTVTASGGTLTVTWPTTSTGFKLYEAPSVNGPWTPASGSATASGGAWSHSLPVDGSSLFLRLQR